MRRYLLGDKDNIKHFLAIAANDFLVASGAGVFVKKTLAETKTILGSVAASQAEQEAGTEAAKYVAPATQQYHPSAAKAWVMVSGAATPAIEAGYNVTSITDNGVGSFVVNFTITFSIAHYGVSGIGMYRSTVYLGIVSLEYSVLPAAGSCKVITINPYSFAAVDIDRWSVSFLGDQ